MIPYGRQLLDQQDIDAVVEVLRSDFLTQGPVVPQFEQAVADYCAAPFAVASNSATSALHLAYLALGVGPGQAVWTSPITFVATANAALYCGASVDFVDIDRNTLSMDVDQLEAKLEEAKRKGKLPSLLVPVHFGGQACGMERLAELSQQYGFRIVEDASHAIGGRYAGTPTGSCRHSDITVFSFHPVKIITTGEGGMATTRDAALAERMRALRSHGITREKASLKDTSQAEWYYEQQQLGFNYRMTDIHAALGLSQLRRIDAFVARRRDLAARYDEALAGTGVELPGRCSGAESSWHLYVVKVPARDRIYRQMREAGIGVNVHYIPVHLQPYYRSLGFRPGDFPVAEECFTSLLTLPLHAALTPSEQDQVIDALARAVGTVRQ